MDGVLQVVVRRPDPAPASFSGSQRRRHRDELVRQGQSHKLLLRQVELVPRPVAIEAPDFPAEHVVQPVELGSMDGPGARTTEIRDTMESDDATRAASMKVKTDPSRLRRLRPELLLLLASIAVSVLLAEGILRVHYAVTFSGTLEDLKSELPPPGTEADFGDLLMASAYPRLVYQFKPHLVDVRWKEVSVSTNSQGFREVTEPGPRDARTIRILGLGDSVMFGLGVEEDERYMDVLEERLNQDFPAARWQTITIAVPGYNLVTEVEALKRYGLAYEPDLVIYGFVFNDFCLPNFVSRRRSVWSFDSFIKYYWNRSGAGEHLVGRTEVVLEGQGLDPAILKAQDRELFQQFYCTADNFTPEYQYLVGEENFHGALRELAQIGRRRGIPTVFLSYGSARGADKIPLPEGMTFIAFDRLYRWYFRRHGYSRITESDLVLSETDIHPSAKGHRMVGNALAERLARLGLVEEMLARKAGAR